MSDAKPANATTTEGPENLEQVRDILFGSQMRTLDRRLAQMEERFQGEHDGVRQELNQRLESLETWARRQVELLEDKLKAERTRRTDELQTLRAALEQGLAGLEQGVGKLEDATSGADAELRDQILGLTRSLSTDIASLSARLTGDLNRVAAELRVDKTDTASLVELFSDVARRLGESLETPTTIDQ